MYITLVIVSNMVDQGRIILQKFGLCNLSILKLHYWLPWRACNFTFGLLKQIWVGGSAFKSIPFFFAPQNVFAMTVVEETFRHLLQKVWFSWPDFVYIDEDFAINWIRSLFLSLLLTDKRIIDGLGLIRLFFRFPERCIWDSSVVHVVSVQ